MFTGRYGPLEAATDESLYGQAAYRAIRPGYFETMRTDLKGWVHHVANEDGEWVPVRAELGFGFGPGTGRDPRSLPEPAVIDGQWKLHGIVDLVEARGRPTAEGELRVTDHKTGKNRTRDRMIVGRGEVLQPVLYGLAVDVSLLDQDDSQPNLVLDLKLPARAHDLE